jgi:hypothetical protein
MEETREATADLPDENCSLVKRNGHQAPTIRREAARRKSLPVTLQHVEARGCLEVVHHNCALARPHGQALARCVEVYSREATQGERKNGSCQKKIEHQGESQAPTSSRHVREFPSQSHGRRLGETWNWGPGTSPPLPSVLEDWDAG